MWFLPAKNYTVVKFTLRTNDLLLLSTGYLFQNKPKSQDAKYAAEECQIAERVLPNEFVTARRLAGTVRRRLQGLRRFPGRGLAIGRFVRFFETFVSEPAAISRLALLRFNCVITYSSPTRLSLKITRRNCIGKFDPSPTLHGLSWELST